MNECPNCGRAYDEEDQQLAKQFGPLPLTCVSCGQEGCEECILPFGRGTKCQDCENE